MPETLSGAERRARIAADIVRHTGIDEAMVERLVHRFYEHVRADALLGPITQMRHDHVEHGRHLQQLRAATNDFVAPEGACRSWRALYAGTAKLTDDLIEHIHLENNVLFLRFQQNRRPDRLRQHP